MDLNLLHPLDISRLEFFDKFGESYNFQQNEETGCWEGKEWLSSISINLFDSINIFVLQKTDDDSHKFPKLYPGQSLSFKWRDRENEDNFFMYDIVRETETGNQFLQKTDFVQAQYGDFQAQSSSYIPPVTNIKAVTNGQNVTVTFDYPMASAWGVEYGLKGLTNTDLFAGTLHTNTITFNTLTDGHYRLYLSTTSPIADFVSDSYLVEFDITGLAATTFGVKIIFGSDTSPLDLAAPLQVNVAFNPLEEKGYYRTLEGYFTNSEGTQTQFLSLEFYGEGESEDERLRIWGENFGIKFSADDALILKDYDLKEGLPDYRQVNQIRKELLVSKDQIFPYVGTYKALANFINLMGYKDVLSVKEYWKNNNPNSEYYNKMGLVDITDFLDDGTIDEMNILDTNRQIKFTNQFKKTSFIALSYEFTKTNGNFDEDGIPEVERTTEFSVNEIFFKLNKLGKKLKREILPLNVQIKDIIGEFIYFQKYNLRYWTDRISIEDIEVSKHLDISIDAPNTKATSLNILDIKSLYSKRDNFFALESFNDSENNPFDNDQKYDPYKIPDLISSITNFYDAHLNLRYTNPGMRPDWESYDEPNAKIGCPVVLTANMPDYPIGDLDGVTIQNMGLNRITVGTVRYANYYEVEWKIQKSGSNPYKFEYRGPVSKLHTIPHILPSVGDYEVECKLFDVFGGVSRKYETVKVEPLSPVIIGVMRLEDKFSYKIQNLNNVTVSDLDGSYVFNPKAIVLDNQADHKAVDVDKNLIDWFTYKNGFGFGMNMLEVEIEREDGVFEPYSVSTHPYKRFWGVAEDGYTPKIVDYEGATVEDLFHSRLYDMGWQADFQNGFYINSTDVTADSGVQIGDFASYRFTGTLTEDLVTSMNVPGIPGVSDYFWSIVGTKLHAQAKFHSKQLHNVWKIVTF